MKERPETRLTVVFGGKRVFEKYNVTIVEDIQDEGRTLKLFVGCSHAEQARKFSNLGCKKILDGTKKYGTLYCGEILGQWIDKVWQEDKSPILCDDCSQNTGKVTK